MQRYKAIVAHPGTQHSLQAALSFYENQMLERYFTSICYSNKVPFYQLISKLPVIVKKDIEALLLKRRASGLDDSFVEQYPWFEFFSFAIRKLFKNQTLNSHLVYFQNRMFDKWVATKLPSLNFDIYIGYEGSSLESFRVCKKTKKHCVLDLASSHWKFKKMVYDTENSISNQSTALFNKINLLKSKELELADTILIPSSYSKDSLSFGGVVNKNIVQIPYGVDTEKFFLKENYNKTKKLSLLYVGAISYAKGVHYLLKAFKELNLKDAELVLIGNCVNRELVDNYKDLITYYKYLPHEELIYYYQSADVLLMPSLDDSFGFVVLEAMACGTPVIVSANTGSKDLIQNGYNGFIVPVKNIQVLKDKIMVFYKNRNETEIMGKQARKTVENYSWQVYREKLRSAINQIIDKQSTLKQ